MSILMEMDMRESVGEHFAKNKPKYELVHINDIRMNDLNFFHINDEEVESLANEIKRRGVNNGKAYYQEGEDGKHYTLLGGHTRYKALEKLFNEGKHDGMFPLQIVEAPKDEMEEIDRILSDNRQRNLSEEDKRKIVQHFNLLYDEYKKRDKELDKQIQMCDNPFMLEHLEGQRLLPKNVVKRDWIASKACFINRNGTTVTGRQIQKYLTGIYSGKEEEKPKEPTEEDKQVDALKNSVKDYLYLLTDTKVSVSKNKLTFTFENIHDLDRILGSLKEDKNLDRLTKIFIQKTNIR